VKKGMWPGMNLGLIPPPQKKRHLVQVACNFILGPVEYEAGKLSSNSVFGSCSVNTNFQLSYFSV
jgi:hypothetical protein